MDRTSTPARHPARLPPGTVVGSWRIEGPAGRGAQGVVYRAVAVGDEHATPVALKLALHPADPRFAREVELLSLTSHPHVPLPHPEPLLEAARRAGMAPADCVYVGDDLRDVQAGRAAGMTTIAVTWGYLGVGEPVQAWQADHVVDSAGQLLNLLDVA